jgi:multiple sugar transport system permease protein
MKVKTKTNLNQGILNAVVVVLLVLMLYPLAMALWNSFKSTYVYDLTRWYPTIPLRVSNVLVAFKAVWQYVLNTLFVGVTGVGGSLIIASLAAYAFSQMRFPGRNLLYALVIVLMMIPGVMSLTPSFILYRSLGFINKRIVLIIPLIAGGPVFGTFLLTTFFGGLPKDLFEAGKIDGASEVMMFLKIAVPLSVPILGTLGIMQIVGVWNDYIWPLATIQDSSKYTISAGLITEFTSQYAQNMPVTFSGYLVASLPLILLFVFCNRYYIEGLTSSAIKM